MAETWSATSCCMGGCACLCCACLCCGQWKACGQDALLNPRVGRQRLAAPCTPAGLLTTHPSCLCVHLCLLFAACALWFGGRARLVSGRPRHFNLLWVPGRIAACHSLAACAFVHSRHCVLTSPFASQHHSRSSHYRAVSVLLPWIAWLACRPKCVGRLLACQRCCGVTVLGIWEVGWLVG